MGVLDDAIREHLDLKRRHGAGEEELRRQEEEALGPARREVGPAEADEPTGEQAAAEAQLAAEAEEAPELSHPEELADSEALHEEPAPPEPIADEPPHGAPPADDQSALGETPQQGFEHVEPERLDDDELGEDELLHDDELLEDDDEPPLPDDDADVLEDTPDFLQETPEHDRLWFEQKPPRDFDFD